MTAAACGCLHGVGEDKKQRQALLDELDEGYFLGYACSLTYNAHFIELEPYPPEASVAQAPAPSEPRQGRVAASTCGTTGSAQAALGNDSNSAAKPPVVIGVRPLGCVQVSSKACCAACLWQAVVPHASVGSFAARLLAC